jgi:hypothetical protein
MAVSVSSTVTRWTGVNDANGATFVSGSFTPANTTLLVCFVEYDTFATGDSGLTYTPSGGGLSWTQRVERTGSESATGGGSSIWTAPVSTGASMTITVTRSGGTTSSTGRVSARALVLAGYDQATPVDTVTASNEGGSGTNNLTTTSVTPGATGLLCAADTEWNALGAFEASSDLTQDTAHYAGAISVSDGYKTCTSGVGVTANLNAAGTGTPQHKWCQIVVREAAGGTNGRPNKITAATQAVRQAIGGF